MKAGWKSTEFWLAAMATASGLVLVLIGLEHGRDSLVAIGAAQQAVSAVGYAIARGTAKAPPARTIGRGH